MGGRPLLRVSGWVFPPPHCFLAGGELPKPLYSRTTRQLRANVRRCLVQGSTMPCKAVKTGPVQKCARQPQGASPPPLMHQCERSRKFGIIPNATLETVQAERCGTWGDAVAGDATAAAFRRAFGSRQHCRLGKNCLLAECPCTRRQGPSATPSDTELPKPAPSPRPGCCASRVLPADCVGWIALSA